MAIPPEGDLTVRLAWDGRQVVRTSVTSTRPLATPRLLEGRTPDEAATLVPLLYSVCAFAQGAAAASALALAGGEAIGAPVARARDLAVALEAVGEDLRRLLIEMPPLVDVAPQIAPVAAARKAMAPMLASLRPALSLASAAASMPDRAAIADLGTLLATTLREHVLGTECAAFLALADADAAVHWTATIDAVPAQVLRHVLAGDRALGASDVRPMPDATPAALDGAVLAALAADRDFARTPRWAGEPVETGALARARAHPAVASLVARDGAGVAARLLACLVDLARTVADLAAGAVPARTLAWSPGEGEGVAAVASARGLLVHRACVVAGRVTRYAIVAPTEWNFHPQGTLVRALTGHAAADERALARDASLVVRSLDPCVACRVEVAHA